MMKGLLGSREVLYPPMMKLKDRLSRTDSVGSLNIFRVV